MRRPEQLSLISPVGEQVVVRHIFVLTRGRRANWPRVIDFRRL